MCVKKQNETATISTLFDDWIREWTIAVVMGNYGKNIDSFRI